MVLIKRCISINEVVQGPAYTAVSTYRWSIQVVFIRQVSSFSFLGASHVEVTPNQHQRTKDCSLFTKKCEDLRHTYVVDCLYFYLHVYDLSFLLILDNGYYYINDSSRNSNWLNFFMPHYVAISRTVLFLLFCFVDWVPVGIAHS